MISTAKTAKIFVGVDDTRSDPAQHKDQSLGLGC